MFSNDKDIYGKCSLFPQMNNADRLNYLVTSEQTETPTQYHYCITARTYSNMCGEKAKLHQNLEKKGKKE